MSQWFARLLNAGVTEETPPQDARYIKTVNTTVLVVFAISFPYSIIYQYFKLFELSPTLWSLGLIVGTYPVVLYLNHKQYYLGAKLLFIALGFFHLSLLGILLDRGSGLDLYILISFMLPWFIFKPGEGKYIAISEVFLYGLYFGVQYFLDQHSPLIQVDKNSLYYFRFVNLNLVILYFILQGHYIYKLSREAEIQVQREKELSDSLLLNILPEAVAKELKEKGRVTPVHYEEVSVLFTDFVGFTKISEKLSPEEIIEDLDNCFRRFDEITEKYGLEKLKTIGDAYMCAAGLPKPDKRHAQNAVLAAMEMRDYIRDYSKERRKQKLPVWKIRIGIHSGPLVAGVVGYKKFAYDVWGDTVNTASRMESAGIPNEINISKATYDLIRGEFVCVSRAFKRAKDKPDLQMYLVKKVKDR